MNEYDFAGYNLGDKGELTKDDIIKQLRHEIKFSKAYHESIQKESKELYVELNKLKEEHKWIVRQIKIWNSYSKFAKIILILLNKKLHESRIEEFVSSAITKFK